MGILLSLIASHLRRFWADLLHLLCVCHLSPDQHTAGDCVPADGSSYLSYRMAGDNATNSTASDVDIATTSALLPVDAIAELTTQAPLNSDFHIQEGTSS